MEATEMKNKLQYIIDTYGTASQVDIAIEECSELTKALLKHRRSPGEKAREDIIDEIADVENMLNQLKIIYNCAAAVADRLDYKVDRQIERIKEGWRRG